MNEWYAEATLPSAPPPSAALPPPHPSNHKADSMDFHPEAPGTETRGLKAPKEFQRNIRRFGVGLSGFQQLMDIEEIEQLQKYFRFRTHLPEISNN